MFCKSLALLVFCSAWHAAESYAGYMLEDKYCKKLMMLEGEKIMDKKAMTQNDSSIKVVTKHGRELKSGGYYKHGQTVMVSYMGNYGADRCFAASGGALFQSNSTGCNQTRIADADGGPLMMPKSGNASVKIWAGVSDKKSTVYLTPYFVLHPLCGGEESFSEDKDVTATL